MNDGEKGGVGGGGGGGCFEGNRTSFLLFNPYPDLATTPNSTVRKLYYRLATHTCTGVFRASLVCMWMVL